MAKGNTAQLAVAKVAAWQAVIVALITTIGGVFIGIWSQRHARANTPPPQRWLTIQSVKFDPQSPLIKKVRLIANVNSVSFSMPIVEPWIYAGADVSPVRFPLPTGDSTFRVRFSGFAVESRDRGEQIKFLCEFLQDFDDINPGKGGVIRTVRLDRAFDTMHCTTDRAVEVTYAIR